ncbi:MAG: NADH-quinone oxidoreductase subunit NuoH [Pirellulaceae bacterium]|nr:NADH-quinone oxidoreductase subunit NuoH [Pirellulaceae bacterium]
MSWTELWTEYFPLLWPTLVAIAFILACVPVVGLYATFVERKIAAAVQDRLGPNRVGPFGLFQAVADGIKIFLKEQIIPSHVHWFFYMLAPCISLMTAMFALCFMPFGPVPTEYKAGFRMIVMPGLDSALLLMFAVSSLSVYGIILGGWASNNKYSIYGAIRSCAQFISYEIPLGMSVLGVIVVAGSMNIETIVDSQQSIDGISNWNIWWQPLALIIFFTSALAETNRLPFDLAECEQELVGGFHTEYGGIKFVLFFLAEYTHVVTISFMTILLFFGGWHFPGLSGPVDASWQAIVIRLIVLLTKVGAVVVLIMLLRWALPRFRFDQLMGLTWKGLIPLAMLNLIAVAVVSTVHLPKWTMAIVSLVLLIGAGQWSASQLQARLRRSNVLKAI